MDKPTPHEETGQRKPGPSTLQIPETSITGNEKLSFSFKQKTNRTGFELMLALDETAHIIGFTIDDDEEADAYTRLMNACLIPEKCKNYMPIVFDFQTEITINQHRLLIHTPVRTCQTRILLMPDENNSIRITQALNDKTRVDPRGYLFIIEEAITRHHGPYWKSKLH